MADRILKPDSGNDLVLQNDDGSAKIEVNEAGTIVHTGTSSIDVSGGTFTTSSAQKQAIVQAGPGSGTLDVSSGTFTTSSTQKTAIVDGGKGNLAASDVGLGNVTNESKATMFTSPTFTGNAALGTNATGTFNGTVGSSATITSGINMPNFTYNLSVGQKRTITIGPNQIIIYGAVNANGIGNSSAGTGVYGYSASSGSPKVNQMWGYIAKNGTREDVGPVLAIGNTLNVRDRANGYFQGSSVNDIGTGTLSPSNARWSAQFNSAEDYELQLASLDGGTFFYWFNIVTA